MLDLNSLRIQNEAENKLTDLGLEKLPVSIEKVCKAMNVEIIEKNMKTDEFDGIAIGNREKATIVINSQISYQHRKKFTKAHELGHVVLHIFTGQSRKFKCTSENISHRETAQKEKEANLFASSILMPSKLITEEIDNNNISWQLIRSLQHKCQVSLEAMARRVIGLSKERCALVIHTKESMWTPIKSKKWGRSHYIKIQPLPQELDYSYWDNNDYPETMEECESECWDINTKEYESLFYSSIHSEKYSKTMTLLTLQDRDSHPINDTSIIDNENFYTTNV